MMTEVKLAITLAIAASFLAGWLAAWVYGWEGTRHMKILRQWRARDKAERDAARAGMRRLQTQLVSESEHWWIEMDKVYARFDQYVQDVKRAIKRINILAQSEESISHGGAPRTRAMAAHYQAHAYKRALDILKEETKARATHDGGDPIVDNVLIPPLSRHCVLCKQPAPHTRWGRVYPFGANCTVMVADDRGSSWQPVCVGDAESLDEHGSVRVTFPQTAERGFYRVAPASTPDIPPRPHQPSRPTMPQRPGPGTQCVTCDKPATTHRWGQCITHYESAQDYTVTVVVTDPEKFSPDYSVSWIPVCVVAACVLDAQMKVRVERALPPRHQDKYCTNPRHLCCRCHLV